MSKLIDFDNLCDYLAHIYERKVYEMTNLCNGKTINYESIMWADKIIIDIKEIKHTIRQQRI